MCKILGDGLFVGWGIISLGWVGFGNFGCMMEGSGMAFFFFVGGGIPMREGDMMGGWGGWGGCCKEYVTRYMMIWMNDSGMRYPVSVFWARFYVV